MNWKLFFWLVVFVMSYFAAKAQSFQLNMTQYYQMPQLYEFDDYDRCLLEYGSTINENRLSSSVYCFVRAEIQSKNNSDAWNAIVEISRYHKHHFDHRHLYFGICVRSCKVAINASDANTNTLFAGILTENSQVNVYLNLFKTEVEYRERFNHLVNECINLRLQHRYGLLAKSVIEYCDTNHKVYEDDAWDLTFYTIVCILIFLVTLSSLFDLYLKYQRHDKLLKDRDYYKTPLKTTSQQVLVAFSLARNWYRLNQEPNGKLGRDLRFLDCFKFFSMFMVIFAHTNWIIYEIAISNPQDPEQLLHTYSGTLLVSGALITVTFFVISGMLMTINWLTILKIQENLTLRQYVVLFIKFNIFRYIRLTVPYGFVVLLSGVYFQNPGGPLWRHIIEREQLACRKNWWTNILYINNIINTNERCLLQGWYLAADTHSFVLSLVLLMIANRYPKWRKQLYSLTLCTFIFIPAFLTYIRNYYPIFYPAPQFQKDSFIDNRQFNEFYTPFHMNFGCYFCGVLTAIVYDKLSTKQFTLRDFKSFQILWYALFPASILWLFSTHLIYQHYYIELPVFWTCIYAGLQRNAWAIGLGIFIVGMTAKVGWIFRKFACLSIFRILGRLTYGTFILHLLIARTVLATIRNPIYFGTGMMFAFIFFTLSFSYLLSFVLAIFLELPVSSLMKLFR